MNTGRALPRETLMDLLVPRPQKPGRMGLFALARMVHRQAAAWSKPSGFTTPARNIVTVRHDGVRMLPVPRRTARKLASRG